MAGLESLGNYPPGTETPTLGDDRIRALTAALIDFATFSHTLIGEHKIARGPLSQRPAAGNSGDLYILEVAGLLAEFQYDTGSAWVTLTSRNDIAAFLLSLANHQAATPIDHPSSSVTSVKIAAGAVLKKHLEGGNDASSIAALVDGASADALHNHPQYDYIIPDGTIGPSKFSACVASAIGIVRGQAPTERTITHASYTKYKEIQIAWAGEYTVSHTIWAAHGVPSGSTVFSQIYRNGNIISLGMEHITTTAGADITVTYNENLTFAVGDLVQLYVYLQSGSVNGTVSLFKILSEWESIVTLD